ncbi:MAG: transposase [Bacteroidetes bacterium]|nr:transposase [Bacteroidota bacterium]
MQLEKGYLYHIYNQGNNQREIFFKRENYLFFLKKIETYILPYTDILAWCLMPNHFHLMVLIREEELPIENEGFTQSEALTSIESEDLIS